MKSLKEFIQGSKDVVLNDSQSLFDYENDYLYWHLVLEYQNKYLFEAYSFVQEICRLSPKIIDEIIYNINNEVILIKDLNASFFKTLEIKLKHKENINKIVNGDGDIDKSNKEHIYITLEFNKKDYDKSELKDSIEHELVHLYQNYHTLKNGKSLRKALDKRGYDEYTDIEDLSNPKDILKLIIYLFDPDETPAKIQGILAGIDDENLSTPKRAWSLVKDSNYYKRMKYYFDNKDNLDKLIPGIAGYYRDIFPKWKSLTKEQIVNKLEKYINKNWKIFINKLSKACVGKSKRTIK